MGSPNPVFPRARFFVAAILFVAWIGFLAFLAIQTREPVVLSRPQFLVSDAVVLATINENDGHPDPAVADFKVVWSKDGSGAKDLGPLIIPALSESDAENGWRGPGDYLLPLRKRQFGKEMIYELTQLPLIPGFRPKPGSNARIYKATSDALAQWHVIAAEWRK